jgi:hypothetical protein
MDQSLEESVEGYKEAPALLARSGIGFACDFSEALVVYEGHIVSMVHWSKLVSDRVACDLER